MDLGSIVAMIVTKTGWTIEYTLSVTFEQALVLINFWGGKKPEKVAKKMSDVEMFMMGIGKEIIKK